jgi:hypothetical protein
MFYRGEYVEEKDFFTEGAFDKAKRTGAIRDCSDQEIISAKLKRGETDREIVRRPGLTDAELEAEALKLEEKAKREASRRAEEAKIERQAEEAKQEVLRRAAEAERQAAKAAEKR